MPKTYAGYPKKGVTFLRQLSKNNNRDWFQEHKATYTDFVRTPMIELVEAVNAKLASFAPDYVAADPGKAVMRINRDIRFSKDKSPYKTNMSAMFPRQGGAKEASAGFYLRISSKGLEVIAGAYMPANPALGALRHHVAENQKTFERIVRRPKLCSLMGDMQGECLKRVPRGWPQDHPAGSLLRHKQFFFHTQLPIAVASTPGVMKELTDRFRAATPFVEFLDEGLSG